MSKLPAYTGVVEAPLRSNPDEILQELIGVIEAAQEKSIKLTKSGIPPKPLWSAVNDRLIWQDPKAILYDWDEVDQIRFVYSVAARLLLVQPDGQRELGVGPGADAFFFCARSRRSQMLMDAYVDVVDWDERCDARNEQGHRYNFGQTFRRDFLRDPDAVRRAMLAALEMAPVGEWVRAEELAVVVSKADPSVLISEDDEAPEIPDGEADDEILRLAEYWVLLAARFGWVDLARTPPESDEIGGHRLFRVTELGEQLLAGKIDDETEESEQLDTTPFVVQPNNEVVFYRSEGDFGDEYLLRRIAANAEMPGWQDPVVTYRVSPDSVRRALETGLDVAVLEERLLARSKTDVPTTFRAQIEDARRRLGKVVLSQGLTAVEINAAPKKARTKLKKQGFSVFGDVAIVPWRRWAAFSEVLGEEVTEGFRYPSDEPLAEFSKRTLKLHWPVLPMLARDFLLAAGVTGDPPEVELTDAKLGELAAAGWTAACIIETLQPLIGEDAPKWLQKLAK